MHIWTQLGGTDVLRQQGFLLTRCSPQPEIWTVTTLAILSERCTASQPVKLNSQHHQQRAAEHCITPPCTRAQLSQASSPGFPGPPPALLCSLQVQRRLPASLPLELRIMGLVKPVTRETALKEAEMMLRAVGASGKKREVRAACLLALPCVALRF